MYGEEWTILSKNAQSLQTHTSYPDDEGFCVFHEPLSLLHLPLKPVIVRTSKCTNNIDNQVHKMGRHRHGHIIIAPIDDVSRVSKKSEY
jgi:hypothetical protein